MGMTLREAAKASGKGAATLSRAIASGKMSAVRNGNSFDIDPAELFRAFPKSKAKNVGANDAERLKKDGGTSGLAMENALLRQKVEFLENAARDKDAEIARVWAKLGEEAEERRKALAVLEDMRKSHAIERRGAIGRLLDRWVAK